jgi:protein SCO1/2
LILAAACASCATHYDARGLVVDVDRAAPTVTVSHEPIADYMDAMVMPFALGDPREAADVQPGDRIAFRLTVARDRSWIDRIRLLSAAPLDAGLAASPAVRTLVPIGAGVPDFALTDHRGERVSRASLDGKVAAITFIYTRCPLPDYCPRLLATFDAVAARFRERLGKDLLLLVATFDPTHDTPAVLREYARRHRADAPGWHFLTGSLDDVGRFCESFGVEFYPEEGLITHSLRTVVIDRRGLLAASVEGRGYSGRQLADLIDRVLTR